MKLMQGDQLEIAVKIKDSKTGNILTSDNLENIEITVGSIIKDRSNGVYFADGTWRFPMTQEETFAMCGTIPVQVRIKPTGGSYIRGSKLGDIYIEHSESRRLL